MKKERQALYQKRIEIEFIPFSMLKDPQSSFWTNIGELSPDLQHSQIIDSFCRWMGMKEEISLLLKDLIRLKKHAEDDTEKLDKALEAEHRLHARNLIIRRKVHLQTKIDLIHRYSQNIED